MAENEGNCRYLLYARTSDPIDKLKRPELEVEHPLLGDSNLRRVIKANTLTMNVDAPGMDPVRRINDTKEYMLGMGMAFALNTETDLQSAKFAQYLKTQEVDLQDVASGSVHLRAKPMKGTYGCYGHVRGSLADRKFRQELRRQMHMRGNYVVQLEMGTPTLTNTTDGTTYTYVDRNFFGMIDGNPQFLGGFRTLMPLDSVEVREGRIHGNASVVYAEIVS